MSNSRAQSLDEQRSTQKSTSYQEIAADAIATVGQTRTDCLGATGVALA